METPEILITLLLAICLLAFLAERTHISQPIVFLLGGIALSFLPGIRSFSIEPASMLTIFLPPLLMEAAYFTSLRDFKRNLRPIMQLAVGLVIITAVAVAWVFVHMVPGGTWATGMVLGAIVSPPDAVAATAILKRMPVPKRIVAILEGESLINDAGGLILYKFAVAAVMTSQFSLTAASGHFLWMILSGIAIGLATGKLFIWIFPRIRELSVEILGTFVGAYSSYMLTEAVDGSGVLAVVATGLYVGWHAPVSFTPRFRIPGEAVWKMTVFVLSGLVFLLIGLKIPALFENLSVYSTTTLAWYGFAICATCLIVRIVYVFAIAYGTRFVCPKLLSRDPYPAWQNVFLISFTGMRGVVSLATALALPVSISWGMNFPHRDLIMFLALCLILFTLVVQGLALPWLIHKLTLTFDSKILYEDWNARVNAARQALAKIEEIEKSGGAEGPALERIKSYYQLRLDSLGDGPNTPLYPTEIPTSSSHPLIQAEERLWHEVLTIERETVVSLRKSYDIGDDVMHDILRELDLLTTRFSHS